MPTFIKARISILRITGRDMTDDELLQWIDSVCKGSARMFFRESDTVCYVQLHDKDQTLLVKHFLKTQVFPAFDDMFVDTLPIYMENRIATVFEYANQSPMHQHGKSTFVRMCASANLTISEWIQLVPKAFDVHRTQCQSRVVVEFNNIEDAVEAVEACHAQSFVLVNLKNEAVNVMVSMQYVSQQYQVSVAKRIDTNLREKIKNEDVLVQSVVDWLYL